MHSDNNNETRNIMEARINELRKLQSQEVENNFSNGELYNECEDKINCLLMYGQETPEVREIAEVYGSKLINKK